MDPASRVRTLPNRGRFIKPCPGTPGHVCCGYRIIHFAQGCTLGCSYCILGGYLNEDVPLMFSNRDELFSQLEETFKNRKGLLRFGTGEFTDSLLFENRYPLHEKLIRFFAEREGGVLEIKTKTVNIEHLLGIDPKDNVIMAWSLNSDAAAGREEPGAPQVGDRIEAARRAQESGYKLAFHFDPLILYPGWEAGYRETVRRLFSRIRPESVVYISMGSLRFPHDMLNLLYENDAGFLYTGEFTRGEDNKVRYFRPLRTKLYLSLKKALTEYVDDSILYLCMELPEVWQDVFGVQGMSSSSLAFRLDSACSRAFGTPCNGTDSLN